jgi:hypothetical protein
MVEMDRGEDLQQASKDFEIKTISFFTSTSRAILTI